MPMLNTAPWNAMIYGAIGINTEQISGDLIAFEDLSLSDNVNMVCTGLKESMADREMDVTSVPLADGMHVNSMYERSKIIKSRHQIIQADGEALETFIDNLKNTIATQEGYLYITRYGSTRRYVATLRNPEAILEDRENWDIDVAPLNLEWLCNEGFGEDVAYSIGTKNVSASPQTHIVNNLGTAKARPVAIFVFNTATSVTAFKLGNDTSGQQIQYTGTISAGDALIFDAEEGTVTLNGVRVAFTGSFINLLKGFNTLRYTVTGSSFDMSVTVKWKRRWR